MSIIRQDLSTRDWTIFAVDRCNFYHLTVELIPIRLLNNKSILIIFFSLLFLPKNLTFISTFKFPLQLLSLSIRDLIKGYEIIAVLLRDLIISGIMPY